MLQVARAITSSFVDTGLMLRLLEPSEITQLKNELYLCGKIKISTFPSDITLVNPESYNEVILLGQCPALYFLKFFDLAI